MIWEIGGRGGLGSVVVSIVLVVVSEGTGGVCFCFGCFEGGSE